MENLMSKSFHDLQDMLNEKHNKSEGSDIGGFRSAGEAEFAKQNGYPVKVGGEYDKSSPQGSDDILNARSTKETDAHDNKVEGERTPIKQGTSTLKDLSGFKNKQTPPRHGDVREDEQYAAKKNNVGAELTKIVETRSAATINFADGDKTLVTPKTAQMILDAHSKLNTNNGKKFMETINKNAVGFLKMLSFASKGRE